MKLTRSPFLFILAILLSGCAAATQTPQPDKSPTPSAAPATTMPADTPLPAATENGATIPFPAGTQVLVWHREGGIAGFCDDVIVTADGGFTATKCGAASDVQTTGHLDAQQLSQLAGWVNAFQSFTSSSGQGGAAADAMILKTSFTGAGTQQAGRADRAAIADFAALLAAPPAPVGTNGDPMAVQKAREYLAGELNVAVDQISVVSYDAVEWPDRCLGVVVMGQMCAMGVTPGYRVILSAQGQQYEIHTDQTGASLRQKK